WSAASRRPAPSRRFLVPISIAPPAFRRCCTIAPTTEGRGQRYARTG
ncbi:MAG: hypothetical protein AVDCRST_MAG25-3035, partial [uncultured Rubrobacteraceae bacterium]